MVIQDVSISDIVVMDNIRVTASDRYLIGLMESIKQHGLKEPIGVSKLKNNRWLLLYGFRRLTAYKKLGYVTIPAVVEKEHSKVQHAIANTIENIHRKDITIAELGRTCYGLIKQGLTAKEIASRLNLSYGRVSNAISAYSRLSSKVRVRITTRSIGKPEEKGGVSASVIKTILDAANRYRFNKDTMNKIIDIARVEELSSMDIHIIARLIDSGLQVHEAIKLRTKYRAYRLDMVVEEELVKKLAAKYNVSPITFLVLAAVGEIKEKVTYPDFFIKAVLARKKVEKSVDNSPDGE